MLSGILRRAKVGAALMAVLAGSPAFSDTLYLSGTTYIGKAFSLNGDKVLFDFECLGTVTAVTLDIGDLLTVGDSCSEEFPPEIGGSSVCSFMPAFDQLFLIGFSSNDEAGEDWITVATSVQVTPQRINFSLDDDLASFERRTLLKEHGVISVERVPGDYCSGSEEFD